jgi:hypothetical protein
LAPTFFTSVVDLCGFLEPSLRHNQLRLLETIGREHGDPFAVKFVHGNNLLALLLRGERAKA